MRVVNKNFLLLFSLFFSVGFLFSQPNYYRFQHLTIDNGLSQNTVNAITQDQYGFIWFGTFSGLDRYDGYTIKNFKFSEIDSLSLSSNQVIELLCDTKGRLWIGTEGGALNRFDYNTQTFLRYNIDDSNGISSNGISSNDVYSIFEDLNGTIWIGTDYGLNKYVDSTDSFIKYYNSDGCNNCLSANYINSIHSSNKSHIWIGTHGGGINKLDIKTDTFEVFRKQQKTTINDNNVWSVYEDTIGKVWIGTETGALNVYNSNSGKWEYYGYSPDEITRLGSNLVADIEPGLNNDLWIGSEGGGLYQLNHGNKRYFKEYGHSIFNVESIASNTIADIYKDKSDILWIGVEDGGVDRLNLKQNPFYRLSHIPNSNSALSNQIINCIIQDSDGLYWIGTEDGLNVGNNKLTHFHHFYEYFNNKSTINNSVITTITEASNGEIWIGTYLGGINIYNKKTNTFRYLTHDESNPNSLPSNFVRSIYEDSDGDFWIGTIRGGLSCYDPDKKKFTNYYNKQNILSSTNHNNIMKIVGDKNSNIYIATYGKGLNIINKKTVQIKTIINDKTTAKSISNNQVISLFFDSDSILWIGTAYGLNRYNIKTEIVKQYFVSNGLPNNTINGIVKDKNNKLWISTNYGIAVYKKEKDTFKNYFKKDGLQSDEYNFNSYAIDNNGRLFFGGINGLAYFNPDEITEISKTLQVQFTELFINNNEVNVGDKYSNKIALHEPLFKTDSLHLTYKENYFVLNFSAMEFANTHNVKYRYWIGKDKDDFVDLGSRNFISFHNLNSGTYELNIIASLTNFSEVSKPTKMIIYIEPPFWGKLWFKVLFIGFFILSVLLFYFLRIYNIKRQKKELEFRVFNKTKDLQDANVMLEENQVELQMQQEELISQRDRAHDQAEKIEHQNRELEKHRTNLEHTVRERTEELYKAKIKAEKADALKTSFLANMSHEIRTPMNAILGFLEILDDPIYTAEERKSFKALIDSSGQTLLTLINDIIDIAKIESGQIDIHISDFNLASIFEELNLIYTKKLSESQYDVNLILELPGDQIISSDNLRVKQVLVNLLNNAFKFTEKGSIKFGYSISDESVKCYVIDTGIGMSKDSYNSIFDRFRKLESPNGKLYGGTGLGLAISKNIIELLGGKIWVESKLNVGSSFTFTLPIKK